MFNSVYPRLIQFKLKLLFFIINFAWYLFLAVRITPNIIYYHRHTLVFSSSLFSFGVDWKPKQNLFFSPNFDQWHFSLAYFTSIRIEYTQNIRSISSLTISVIRKTKFHHCEFIFLLIKIFNEIHFRSSLFGSHNYSHSKYNHFIFFSFYMWYTHNVSIRIYFFSLLLLDFPMKLNWLDNQNNFDSINTYAALLDAWFFYYHNQFVEAQRKTQNHRTKYTISLRINRRHMHSIVFKKRINLTFKHFTHLFSYLATWCVFFFRKNDGVLVPTPEFAIIPNWTNNLILSIDGVGCSVWMEESFMHCISGFFFRTKWFFVMFSMWLFLLAIAWYIISSLRIVKCLFVCLLVPTIAHHALRLEL